MERQLGIMCDCVYTVCTYAVHKLTCVHYIIHIYESIENHWLVTKGKYLTHHM